MDNLQSMKRPKKREGIIGKWFFTKAWRVLPEGQTKQAFMVLAWTFFPTSVYMAIHAGWLTGIIRWSTVYCTRCSFVLAGVSTKSERNNWSAFFLALCSTCSSDVTRTITSTEECNLQKHPNLEVGVILFTFILSAVLYSSMNTEWEISKELYYIHCTAKHLCTPPLTITLICAWWTSHYRAVPLFAAIQPSGKALN